MEVLPPGARPLRSESAREIHIQSTTKPGRRNKAKLAAPKARTLVAGRVARISWREEKPGQPRSRRQPSPSPLTATHAGAHSLATQRWREKLTRLQGVPIISVRCDREW